MPLPHDAMMLLRLMPPIDSRRCCFMMLYAAVCRHFIWPLRGAALYAAYDADAYAMMRG